MYLTPEKEAVLKRGQMIKLAQDTVTFLKRRRFFNRAEALQFVLHDTYQMAAALENDALMIGQEYSSADYVIETAQTGDTQTFKIKKRK